MPAGLRAPARAGCRSLGRTALLALGSALTLVACRSSLPDPAPPIVAAASELMLAAVEESRVPGFGSDIDAQERAVALAEEALVAAPDWAFAERFLDDWHHRPWLTAPERYGDLLARAADGDAKAAYLAGRLGGDAGRERIATARKMEPRLPWAHHGLAWLMHSSGASVRAIRGGKAAFTLARDPAERVQFAIALARYLDASDERSSAENLLKLTLAEDGPLALRPSERAMVEAVLASLEFESVDPSDVRRGMARALRLLAGNRLDENERMELTLRARTAGKDLVSTEEIALALLDARGGARTAAEHAAISRALALVRQSAPPEAEPSVGLAQAFAAGAPGAAVEAWFAALPEALVRGVEPLLRSELLLVRERVSAFDGSVASAGALADALIAAGWFREARAFAGWVATTGDLALSQSIDLRATEGTAALASARALAGRVDAHTAFVRAGAVDAKGTNAREGPKIETLRELERELARLLARAGGETGKSPMIRYGPAGEVLHPGPTFSAEDERLGRGAEGEPVPGVAALFARLGRFALVGRGIGQGGPDATILRLLAVERRSGEHLGRPYSGTVFWCDGADVPGRFGRRGAAISGAALHEGYYVDLSMVRREVAGWETLGQRFSARPVAVARALAVRGAVVPPALRTETTPALGAADRMRLAVMAERGGSGGGLVAPGLGEFAEIVATHEEGHLCDRGGWYPITLGRTLRLIAFAASHGFDGGAISRALEARAQLVALCCVSDPRLAWIDILDAAESAGGRADVTPHARAYRGLLESLIARLEDEYAAGGWRDLDLDPARRWIDQLHRVDPESLRTLAVREAAARGLTQGAPESLLARR